MPRSLVAMLFLPMAACAGPRPAVQPSPGAASRAAATDWSQAGTVTVSLDEFRFEPAAFTLHAGQPVRLHLVNNGARSHDFTSPGFFNAVALRPGAEASAVLAAGGSVDLSAGQARDVLLLPLTRGSYEFECTRPLHATFGMRGRVVID